MLHQLLAAADGIDHIGTDQFPGSLALECRNGIIEADIEWIPWWVLSRLWRRLFLAAFLGGFWIMQFLHRHLRLLIGCGGLMKASRCPHPRRRPCSCRLQIMLLLLLFPAQQIVVDDATCCMKTSRRCCWPWRRTTSAAAAGVINQSNCTMRWGAQGTQLSHYRDRLGDWKRLKLDVDSMGTRCGGGFLSLPSVLLFLSLAGFSSSTSLLYSFAFSCY